MNVNRNNFRKNRKWLRLAFILVPIAAIIDVFFPSLVGIILNRQLQRIKSYVLRGDHVHISWLTRTLVVDGFCFDKKNFNSETPLILAQRAEMQFNWMALWKGELVGSIKAMRPQFFITIDRKKQNEWFYFGIPFSISVMELKHGEVKIIDLDTQPNIETTITAVQATAVNLTDTANKTGPLPTAITAIGNICNGDMSLSMTTDLFEKRAAFDLNCNMHGLDLSLMNTFFLAHFGFEVKQGKLDLYTEVAAKKGQFKGYIKPIAMGIEIGQPPGEEQESLLRSLWEAFLNTLAEIFTNPQNDELGSKIIFEGTFKHPEVNVGFAVLEVYYNAFVHALKSSVDNEINILSVNEGHKTS